LNFPKAEETDVREIADLPFSAQGRPGCPQKMEREIMERIALIISEFAHGRIGDRPWGVAGSPHDAAAALELAFANLPYLFGRAFRGGLEQRPLIRGIGYLILSALKFFSAEAVAEVIDAQFRRRDDEPLPEALVKIFLDPILSTLLSELAEVCSSDCPRFMAGAGDKFTFDNEPFATYWQRLRPEGKIEAAEGKDEPILWIQKTDLPCKVGFPIEQACPLIGRHVEKDDLAGLLAVVERVSDFRSVESRSAG